MKTLNDLKAFQQKLGYDFSEVRLLIEALTHPSIKTLARPNNQRLEFLGDRILGMFVAEALLKADAEADEGTLAPRLNALVRKEALAEIAEEISLGAVLRLGRSEALSGGRFKAAVLADALEAVIAAVYLDGGYHCAGEFVGRLWARPIKGVAADARDAKTILQEWAQAKGYAPPFYEQTHYSGPAHAPEFLITARLENGENATGKAGTKRQAEQLAAQEFLDQIGKDD